MKFSYLAPRNKSIFTPDVQVVLVFFGITLSMLFGTYIFLASKDYRFAQEKIAIAQNIEGLKNNIEKMNAEIKFVEKEAMLSERIFTKNSVLKDSIINMFDLVPQRIILSEANLLENGLILYGITPSKDVYNFMLQAPLRSIFHKTYSSFYPAQNGWIRFVSTNYLDEDEFAQSSESEDKTEEVEHEK